MGKTLYLILITFLSIVSVLLAQSTNNAESTGFYGRDSGINPAAFTLTIFSPNNQTNYVNTLPLNFNITWTTYPILMPNAPRLKADYAYRIDSSPFVNILSNETASDKYVAPPENNFKVNPSFSYLLNISNLENGYHTIVIKASLYYSSEHVYFNETSTPTLFLVQILSPTPFPIVTDFLPLAILVVSIALILLLVAKLAKKSRKAKIVQKRNSNLIAVLRVILPSVKKAF